jgi:pyrophosphatase PpaX
VSDVLLFDLDGTILDTTDLIVESFIYTFAEGLGQTVTRAEVMPYFGRSLDEQFYVMRPDLSAAEVSRLVGLYRRHNHAHHDGMVTVMPGAAAVLQTLAAEHVPMGIVTSKRLDMTRQGLDLYHLWPLFACVVHHDSTVQHKPAPDPVLRALEEMGASAPHSWYIGDSPYDMQSAKAAGCHAVGFCYNTFAAQELVDAGAEHLVRSWQELYAWWGSRSEPTLNTLD